MNSAGYKTHILLSMSRMHGTGWFSDDFILINAHCVEHMYELGGSVVLK